MISLGMANPNPRGVTIRVFLVDGKPQGLRVVDRAGWTGACLAFARADYAEARLRPEVQRTGVYVLVGPDESGQRRERIYIGEGDEVRARIDSHHREKDFWTHGYVLTTKDDSLNKAHVRYLEARLLSIAVEADLAVRDNGTTPPPLPLGESEESDMEWYLQNALTLLPLVGVTLFEIIAPVARDTPSGMVVAASTAGKSYRLKTQLTDAVGRDDPRGFTVLENSLGRLEEKVMSSGYRALRQQLRTEGVLVPHNTDQLRLIKPYTFDSPSSAASVMSGGSKNGRDEWRDENGKSLKENQARVADSPAIEDPA
jgi:hypothetical protein